MTRWLCLSITSSNDFLHFLVNLARDSRGIMYDLVQVQAVPYYQFAFKGYYLAFPIAR